MIPYLRFLTGKERTREANRHLGLTLSFVAGAVNAGGYLAVSRYTSHITGTLSSIPDNLALDQAPLALAAGASFAAFTGGAVTSSLLISWARRAHLQSQYALVLMVEAVLMLAFGLAGFNREALGASFVSVTVLLLCFTMGLQNAIITKLSDAEIRTTHMTGNATDMGIELGKILFWRGEPKMRHHVAGNIEKFKVHASLIAWFVLGGLAGAWGFKYAGYAATLPVAVLLFLIAAVPIWDDLTDED